LFGIFDWCYASHTKKIKANEELHENSVVIFSGSDLHGSFFGGQADLQKDRQELSDEQQQGMQLREKLRLQ